ncbi:MAG TPA: hypothetical protein H9708_02915 [Candidatus Borkfalkia stercoripullorum]|nr:hypothetical protein [Candidatus Borkfalkia stercoripullorum]
MKRSEHSQKEDNRQDERNGFYKKEKIFGFILCILFLLIGGILFYREYISESALSGQADRAEYTVFCETDEEETQ